MEKFCEKLVRYREFRLLIRGLVLVAVAFPFVFPS